MPKNKLFQIIFLIFCLVQVNLCLKYEQKPLQLIKMTDFPNAKCLDGSPSAIYWREGSGENIDKFIFYFQGGGWCSALTLEKTIEDCIKRSKTNLGSSDNYEETANFGGIFSQSPQRNPHFYNYNHVYLNYCDGTGHQGYREDSVKYDSQQVWFRGQMNTEAAFNYALEKLNMKNASQVIVSGSSAGGLACFSWVDFIADKFYNLGTHAQVMGACDSGVFLDFEDMNSHIMDYQIKLKNFMYFSNSEVPPMNSECVKDYQDDQWKCMLAQYLINYIQTRTLILQSEYDSWCINNIIGAKCISGDVLTQCNDSQLWQIEEYRSQLMDTINKSVYQLPQLGYWAPACIIHTFVHGSAFNSENWRVPEHSMWSVDKAIYQFSQNYQIKQFDQLPWPSNQPCSNVEPQLLEQ